MVQLDQLIARAMAHLDTKEYLPYKPVFLPKSLYDQAKARGFNMDNYIIQQMMPTKD